MGAGDRGMELVNHIRACPNTEVAGFADVYSRRLETASSVAPGAAHNPRSLCHAVTYGISAGNKAIRKRFAQAGREVKEKDLIPHWHPGQLRHSHATRVRRMFGLDHAQAALGHATLDATQLYAEKNAALAVQVAMRIG